MHRRTLLTTLGLAPLVTARRVLGRNRPAALVSAAQARATNPDVDLVLTAAPGEVPLLPGAPTRVWRFTGELITGPAGTLQVLDGSYLGPVIRLVRGQRVRIRFENRLPEPSIVHWHGLDVPEAADGHPRLAVDAGGRYVYDFTVTNRAGTYWYHPHPHMRTGPQVYQGLAGMLIVSDPEEQALQFPSGDGEILCVLQDRRFDAGNQLLYPNGAAAPAAGGSGRGMGMRGGRGRGMGMGGMGMGQAMELMNGWVGARMLVNGQVTPPREAGRRTYRVRLLNGSNARFYKLGWSDGTAITVIGTDGGLLEQPRVMPALTLAPGQRADLLLDLSGHARGSEVSLRSLPFADADVGRVGMMGETSPVPQGAPLTLMTLRVTGPDGPRVATPARLSTHVVPSAPNVPVRRVPITFMQMNWLLDGRTFDVTGVTAAETMAPGSMHIWEFVNQPNPMGMMAAHPIHVHGPQFRVLSRSGGTANALREGLHDQGWMDTVVVLPGETVRVQFTCSTHPGLYLYHCHILEHEDMGMMRNFRIQA